MAAIVLLFYAHWFFNTAIANEAIVNEDISQSVQSSDIDQKHTSETYNQSHSDSYSEHEILSHLFNLGMHYVENEQYREGIKYFREMLVINPELHRPRLELARALYQTHQYQSSQYHFEIVLSDQVPVVVAHNIQAYLRSIRSKVAHFTIRFELINDSNVNRATRQKFIYIGGLRFNVDDNSQAVSKIGQGINVNGRIPISKDASWNMNGNAEHREFETSDYDYSYLNLNVGKTIESGIDSLAIDVGRHWAGYAGQSLFHGNILGINHQRRLKNNLRLRNRLTHFNLDYYDHDSRDATQYSAQSEIQYQTQTTHQFKFSTAYTIHDASSNIHSYCEPRIHAEWLSEWTGGWLFNVMASVSFENHFKTDPIFIKKRKDTEKRAELTVRNRTIQMLDFTPQLHFGRVKNHSNIAFYSWDQNYFKVSFSNDF